MNKLREQDVLLTALLNGTQSISSSLSSLEKARNQAATDPAELKQLRTANEQLIQQNGELAAAHQRIQGRSNERWKEIQDMRTQNIDLKKTIRDLRAENASLRELLAVTDQHAGEIVCALAVHESEATK